MSGRNWEPEDGMGFAGMVPTAAEKSQERYEERQRQQTAQLRAALAASEQRNRELTARLDAAEKLVRKCRDEMGGLPHSLGYAFTHLPEIDAWLATPAQPAEGEERT